MNLFDPQAFQQIPGQTAMDTDGNHKQGDGTMTGTADYQADHNAAQAAGHHVDCDGFRTAHRVSVERVSGCYRAVCDDCGELHPGLYGQRIDAVRLHGSHSSEVACDGRCCMWSAAA